jgi:hypothetical protein
MKSNWIIGLLTTLMLLTANTMQGQTIEIKATTVGQVNGISVAASGVYKDIAPGWSARKRVIDLTVGGKETISPVYAGQKLEFGGEAWLVQKVKKPCFGKGSVVLVKDRQ